MKQTENPPVGMALWLLTGGSLPDHINWLIEKGFEGISLLQGIMDADPSEREEAAAVIKEAELSLTYHGNVHHKLTESGELDSDFGKQMIEDVIWWHENTNGVYSCCSDAIHSVDETGAKLFSWKTNAEHMKMIANGLGIYGIHYGIENNCGGPDTFSSIEHMDRFKAECGADNIGLLFDAAHGNIHVRSDGIETEDEISTYIEQIPFEIHEVHFSDNFGEKDEHKKLGYGNLDLEGTLCGLKSKGFSGKLTVEVCVDILSGKYGADINNSEQTDPLLISKERIVDVWNSSGQ